LGWSSSDATSSCQELDLNQDGLLSFQEMDELLQTLAPQLSQGQRQKLFCAADVTLDGRDGRGPWGMGTMRR
jgi:Ca2+-binding EF-hand superfamily protein